MSASNFSNSARSPLSANKQFFWGFWSFLDSWNSGWLKFLGGNLYCIAASLLVMMSALPIGLLFFGVLPLAMAQSEIFQCQSLSSADYAEAGLSEISDIFVQSNGVCEASYHERQITISAMSSDQIPQIQFTTEYQNNILSSGKYDVIKIANTSETEDSPCMELIVGESQIIAVTADTCAVTTRVVYEIINHKL